MIELSDDVKKFMITREHDSVVIDGVTYFFKVHVAGMEYSELVAEELCHILGIRCAHYETISLDDNIYYLSKHLNTIGKFIPGDDLGNLNNSLYDIWRVLEEYYGDALIPMDDLVKIYLFDLIFLNSDRDNRNFGLVREGNETHIYAFDNEFILDINETPTLTSKYGRGEELKQYKQWPEKTYEEQVLKENMHELEFFLSESDSKYYDILVEMMKKVPVEVFEQVCSDVERKVNSSISYKDLWIDIYRKNYEAICFLLEDRKTCR